MSENLKKVEEDTSAKTLSQLMPENIDEEKADEEVYVHLMQLLLILSLSVLCCGTYVQYNHQNHIVFYYNF